MSKSASEVLAELMNRAFERIKTCVKLQQEEEKKYGCNTDEGNFLGVEIDSLKNVLRWIDELSTSDEQTKPGLLPCPFCGSKEVECVCVSNSHACATVIVCSQCNIEFFHRYGKHQEAWNTRANKTQ